MSVTAAPDLGAPVRRLRVLAAAVLVVGAFATRVAEGDRALVVTIVVALIALDGVSALAARTRLAGAVVPLEVVVDATVAVVVAEHLVGDNEPLAWAALAMPVLEGAARGQLRGCLGAWLAVAGLALALTGLRGDAVTTPVLQQLAAVLAVSVPSAYIAQTLRRASEGLDHAATHDPLTGLANRTLLVRVLERRLRSLRRGERVAVAFVDLDGFKSVNDTWGHEAGDRVLVEIAARLRAVTRTSDVVARLGGDEFVAVMSGAIGDETIDDLVARIRVCVAEPIRLGARRAFIGASIGTAVTGDATTDASSLVSTADRAMYRGKRVARSPRGSALVDARDELGGDRTVQRVQGAP